tara:strand:- start:2672 stop:3244 length:573 start_codon:yes stop_codon:yes gene_type:complete
MKRNSILLLLIVAIIFSCKNDSTKENELLQKENELLKKEIELERRENSMDKKKSNKSEIESEDIKSKPSKRDLLSSNISEFNMLHSKSENIKVQYNGDFVIDMGSASSGRVAGNLKNLNLSFEHLPERPGCADVCPEMIVIKFDCKLRKKCISEPTMSDFYSDSGTISIANISVGKKTFELLNRINKNLN